MCVVSVHVLWNYLELPLPSAIPVHPPTEVLREVSAAEASQAEAELRALWTNFSADLGRGTGHALRARATARAPQSSFSASQGRLAAGPAPFGGTWHLGAVFTAEPPVWGSASGASTPHFVPTHPRPRSLCRPLHLVFPRSSRSEPLGPTHVVPAAEARGAEAGSRHTPPAPRRGSGLWGRRPAAVRRNVGLFGRRAKSIGGIQR